MILFDSNRPIKGNKYLFENENSQNCFQAWVERNAENLQAEWNKGWGEDFWIMARAIYTGNQQVAWKKN